jgi:hypothetical protein
LDNCRFIIHLFNIAVRHLVEFLKNLWVGDGLYAMNAIC